MLLFCCEENIYKTSSIKLNMGKAGDSKESKEKYSKDFKKGYKDWKYTKPSWERTEGGGWCYKNPLATEGGDYKERLNSKGYLFHVFEGKEIPKGRAVRVASELMKRGIEEKAPMYSLEGARLYHALGFGNRKSVKKRLLKGIKTKPDKRYFEAARELLEELKKEKIEVPNIENKVLASIFGISLGLGIIFAGYSLTGAVIGLSPKEYTGFLGALLFIAGIVGLFFIKANPNR